MLCRHIAVHLGKYQQAIMSMTRKNECRHVSLIEGFPPTKTVA